MLYVPKRQSTEVVRVADLEIVKPEYGKVKEPRSFNPMQSMNPEIGKVTIRRITKLREDLAQHHSGNLLLHHVWPIEPDKHQIEKLEDTHTQPPSSPTS